jgi:hypothetical protein
VVFWVITRRRVVIIYRRFGTTYRSHPHGSRFRVGKKAYNIETGKHSGIAKRVISSTSLRKPKRKVYDRSCHSNCIFVFFIHKFKYKLSLMTVGKSGGSGCNGRMCVSLMSESLVSFVCHYFKLRNKVCVKMSCIQINI